MPSPHVGDLPEGLHLDDGLFRPGRDFAQTTHEGVITIRDAQDHLWVSIHEAALGDPPIWREAIIHLVSEALGVPSLQPGDYDTERSHDV
jgi:hypothetical protein